MVSPPEIGMFDLVVPLFKYCENSREIQLTALVTKRSLNVADGAEEGKMQHNPFLVPLCWTYFGGLTLVEQKE